MATSQGFVRPRLSRPERLAVTAGLVAFVLVAYAVVVVAVGAALGRTDSPSVGPMIVGAAVVGTLVSLDLKWVVTAVRRN